MKLVDAVELGLARACGVGLNIRAHTRHDRLSTQNTVLHQPLAKLLLSRGEIIPKYRECHKLIPGKILV